MINDIHKDGSRLLSKKLFKYKDGQIEVYWNMNYRQQNVSAMAGFGVLITFGFFI
jgi:hypothetical protein